MTPDGRDRSTGRRRRWIPLLAALLLSAGFSVLGVWQLERRAWKLDLIARVERRINAAPTAPPGPDAWSGVSADRDAYRRVQACGVFAAGKDTLVQAVTDEGPGFWVITPLHTNGGYEVLVNRGFVPADLAAAARQATPPPSGGVTVTGLLRISEPHGGFLRANQPSPDRWYSRDVAAIAEARGLTHVAPYFIDAEAMPQAYDWPRGGLTVVRFPNSHLAYALTWFALAAMCLGWAGWSALESGRRRSV